MRRVVGDSLEVSIVKLAQTEERRKPGLARSVVTFSHYEVTVNGISYVIVKSPQQIEELAALLRLEVFHVQLPPVPSSKSPRGGTGAATTLDDYLMALAEIAPSLSESKTFRAFLTTNVAPSEPTKFWEVDVKKKGWLSKKKGDRAKLQKRFCILKFGTLYYFKNEGDMNPAGSIRLDLVEVTFFRDPENRVGFTLQGGRKHNPRTFVTENQPECDRWVAEIRAVRAAHEKCISVQGVLNLFVGEGRNLGAQNLYVQSMAEAQQFTTNVASKCGGNPTWTTAPSSFQITSNRKFLYCLVWDQPSAALASPSCVGEISIPIGELATVYKGKFDQWVPLCPQTFLQSACGEIHISVDYTFIPDEKTLEDQLRLVELNYQTVGLVIDWFGSHPEALRVEGLFRVPGRLLAMQEIWNSILQNGPVESCLENQSVEDIGGLLKMCLRNVTTPVFPFETFEAVCALNAEDKGFSAAISDIVKKSFSPSAQKVLVKLLQFLREVAKYEEYNKMSCANLSVVFGPAVLREEEDSLDLLYYLPKINAIVKKMIEVDCLTWLKVE